MQQSNAIEQFGQALSYLHSGSVSDCFYYPGMSEVPEGFDRFARKDAAQFGLSWEDTCPAYALALISKGTYKLPGDEPEMETLWDELGGQSTQLWPQVRDTVVRAWDWLQKTS